MSKQQFMAREDMSPMHRAQRIVKVIHEELQLIDERRAQAALAKAAISPNHACAVIRQSTDMIVQHVANLKLLKQH